MDTWYWVFEYGKVFCGYLFLMFIWPLVVFEWHLRTKDVIYRFSFCVTVQIVIINIIVLRLGLFHILNQQIVMILFYGPFIAALMKKIAKRRTKTVDTVKKKQKLRRRIRLRIKEIWWRFSMRAGEYSTLAVILIFGIMYFSYGSSQVCSYGFGDLYVHHEWIYALTKGNVFSGGVYPQGMHCFIYCLDALFGIRVYSSLLFLQGIHVAVLLFSAYALLREVFHWRYTPMFVLALFLTLDLLNADQIYSMFRLQITLPQEFGLHTQFLCALFLVRYLKDEHRFIRNQKPSRYYWSDNLFLFMMSLAASISVHFYTTIMAFVMCAAFAVFAVKKIFVKKRLIPLAAAVLCGCFLAVMPMAGALASGVPFNYSIRWAVNTMDGEETRNFDNSTDKGLQRKEKSVKLIPANATGEIYEKGYKALYGRKRANVILCITGAVIAACVLLRKRDKWNLRKIVSGYLPMILFTFLFVLIYAAPHIGLPSVISDSRFLSVGHMMVLAVVMMPADMVFSVLSCCCREFFMQVLSCFLVLGIYVSTIVLGHFHGYLFYELTRYNAAVELTNTIIESFPKKDYVIVAPTDELYPVIKYGWHEELQTFIRNTESESYTLSPGHVFIYVEKRPLQYAQAYFFQGPSWLAQEKYMDIYWDKYSKKYPDTGASQAPKITASEVSEKAAGKQMPEYENSWFTYTKHDSRTILESKAYDWCRRFQRQHPLEMDIYYEDDDFVCYYFRQDLGMPFNLGMN